MDKNIQNKVGDRPNTKDITNPISNHNQPNYHTERIILPLPPEAKGDIRFEMEIYARFMRNLRSVPNSRMEIKILSAIQFTADLMDTSDAMVAKILVDCGLKAPRKAYPVSFLDFVDKSMMRTDWEQGAPQLSVLKLHGHWNKIGEDRFTHGLPGQYAVYNENSYVTV